jgi:hypothetical protein
MSEPTVTLHPSDILQLEPSTGTPRSHGDRERSPPIGGFLVAGPRASESIMHRSQAPGVARCLTIVVLAVAGVSVSASSAHASSSTTCTGSSGVSYSPGMKFTRQTISWTITDTYSSCTSTDTSLTAGGFSVNVTAEASCNDGVSIIPPTDITITWNNSQSSTIELTTVTDVLVAGEEQVTGVGTVTSGEFNGGDVTIVWLYPLLNPLQCLSSQGVTSQSGTVVVEIIVP